MIIVYLLGNEGVNIMDLSKKIEEKLASITIEEAALLMMEIQKYYRILIRDGVW